MEMLMELTEDLQEKGPVSRERAHREGLLHGVVHLWIVSRKDGEPRICYEDPEPAFHPGEEVSRMVWLPLETAARRETEGTDAVTAYNEDGTAFTIRGDEWCKHPGEFKELVLPVLEKEWKR